MSRTGRGMTAAKIKRWKKEGRGSGTMNEYKPWLTVQDVPSTGKSHRAYSWTSGRECHLLSTIEWKMFILCDWSDKVKDIREQFPLDFDATLQIAEELNIKHPVDPYTEQLPWVMTTDLLLTMDDGDFAVSIKPYSELADNRNLEKFDIERAIWQRQGVKFNIVTELDIPETYFSNVRWCRQPFELTNYRIDPEDVSRIRRIIEPRVLKQDTPLKELTNWSDDKLGYQQGDSLTAVRHLIASKQWTVDMDQPIVPTEPLELLSVTLYEGLEGRNYA